MQKIISLFQRNYDGDHLVRNEVVPGAEWVLAGEGHATPKYDGTCCLYKDGTLWKRYDAKAGKPYPAGFVAAQKPDPKTGHWPGWLAIGDGPEDQYHREALANMREIERRNPQDGATYELCGPKVNGNNEGFSLHRLLRHGDVEISFPRTFDEIKAKFAAGWEGEGVVWHHPDGMMVKIKVRDFGFKRLAKSSWARFLNERMSQPE